MKHVVFLIILLASVGAIAQRPHGEDSVTLRDGRRILRIDVGDDRDDRDNAYRIYRLERAVRELQDQVYQLRSAPAPRPVVIAPPPRTVYFVCSASFPFSGLVTSRGNTESEARAGLTDACAARSPHRVHCINPNGQVSCERGEE